MSTKQSDYSTKTLSQMDELIDPSKLEEQKLPTDGLFNETKSERSMIMLADVDIEEVKGLDTTAEQQVVMGLQQSHHFSEMSLPATTTQSEKQFMNGSQSSDEFEVVDQSENESAMGFATDAEYQGSQNLHVIDEDTSQMENNSVDFQSEMSSRMDNAYFEANNGQNSSRLPYEKQETQLYQVEDAKTEFDQESLRLGTEINFDESSRMQSSNYSKMQTNLQSQSTVMEKQQSSLDSQKTIIKKQITDLSNQYDNQTELRHGITIKESEDSEEGPQRVPDIDIAFSNSDDSEEIQQPVQQQIQRGDTSLQMSNFDGKDQKIEDFFRDINEQQDMGIMQRRNTTNLESKKQDQNEEESKQLMQSTRENLKHQQFDDMWNLLDNVENKLSKQQTNYEFDKDRSALNIIPPLDFGQLNSSSPTTKTEKQLHEESKIGDMSNLEYPYEINTDRSTDLMYRMMLDKDCLIENEEDDYIKQQIEDQKNRPMREFKDAETQSEIIEEVQPKQEKVVETGVLYICLQTGDIQKELTDDKPLIRVTQSIYDDPDFQKKLKSMTEAFNKVEEPLKVEKVEQPIVEASAPKIVEPVVKEQVNLPPPIQEDHDKIELPLTASQIVEMPVILTLGKNDSFKEPENEDNQVPVVQPKIEKGIKMKVLSESYGSNKNHSVLYLARDEYFSKTWLIQNLNSFAWTKQTKLAVHCEDKKSPFKDFQKQITSTVLPGSTYRLTLNLKAPSVPDEYSTSFKFTVGEIGQPISESIKLRIKVLNSNDFLQHLNLFSNPQDCLDISSMTYNDLIPNQFEKRQYLKKNGDKVQKPGESNLIDIKNSFMNQSNIFDFEFKGAQIGLQGNPQQSYIQPEEMKKSVQDRKDSINSDDLRQMQIPEGQDVDKQFVEKKIEQPPVVKNQGNDYDKMVYYQQIQNLLESKHERNRDFGKKFQGQLKQLYEDFGFKDFKENLNAILQHKGDLNAIYNSLLEKQNAKLLPMVKMGLEGQVADRKRQNGGKPVVYNPQYN